MKEYISPEIDILEIVADDIITTSQGTETTPKDENDGIWDLSICFIKSDYLLYIGIADF